MTTHSNTAAARATQLDELQMFEFFFFLIHFLFTLLVPSKMKSR